MWWEEQKNQSEKWGPTMGLDHRDLRMKLAQLRTCFIWMNREHGFLKQNVLLLRML